MQSPVRSLSSQESRVVLELTGHQRRETTRAEIIKLLGGAANAADHIIDSLRRKGWLARAAWGRYLLIPPEEGPNVLGDSNLLALASRIANPYYFGYSTAASHYGLSTQYRNVILVVTPARVRDRALAESRVSIINPSQSKFFGFEPVDVLGYRVNMSDREKTAVDCVDRPELSGGLGEATAILANASRRMNWPKFAEYVERINSGTLARRLGWLLDHVGASDEVDLRNRLRYIGSRTPKTWLGGNPSRGSVLEGAIGYDKKWRVFVNVTPEELQGTSGLGRRMDLEKER